MSYVHRTHKYETKLSYGRKGKATKAAAPPESVMLIFLFPFYTYVFMASVF